MYKIGITYNYYMLSVLKWLNTNAFSTTIDKVWDNSLSIGIEKIFMY